MRGRGVLRVLTASLLGVVATAAQTGTDTAPVMAEAFFKNVQVLKGIPVDEFMDAMGMFSASLGYDCVSCHSAEIYKTRDAFAISTAPIQRARGMIAMVNAINRSYFGGEPRVSCFTCHHGQDRPDYIHSLALQYGLSLDDPSAIRVIPDNETSVDRVFDKYLQVLGGRERLASVTSLVGRGTYDGSNTGVGNLFPLELYIKAPNQRTQIVHGPDGDNVKVFDGRSAWVAERWRPLTLMTFTGGNLEGVRLETLLWFPATLRETFRNWIATRTTIDNRVVQLLQGANDGQLPVNFYFDDDGLLVRSVRWNRTPVGNVPVQTDYSDYRDVAGVKVPFHLVVTWTDGRDNLVLNQVQANVAIDASRFARPVPFRSR